MDLYELPPAKCCNYIIVHLPVFYCQISSNPKQCPQQLHVALDDNELLPLLRVQGGPLGGHDVSGHAEH